MAKNPIQDNKMKGYFIESAKKIIRGEGLRAISVRNIAKDAGYSYATLYNYFTDIKELLYLCLNDFVKECIVSTKTGQKFEKANLESLKIKTKSFIKYFVQYPGFFDIIFNEKMPEISKNKDIIVLIHNMYLEIFSDEYKRISKRKELSESEVMNCHIAITSGLLNVYLNRQYPEDYNQFLKLTDDTLEIMYKKKN